MFIPVSLRGMIEGNDKAISVTLMKNVGFDNSDTKFNIFNSESSITQEIASALTLFASFNDTGNRVIQICKDF